MAAQKDNRIRIEIERLITTVAASNNESGVGIGDIEAFEFEIDRHVVIERNIAEHYFAAV